MPETQQQRIEYWEQAIVRVEKQVRRIKVKPADLEQDSPAWHRFYALSWAGYFAAECLKLAKAGQFKPENDWKSLGVLDEI